jgi:hypothetical protein
MAGWVIALLLVSVPSLATAASSAQTKDGSRPVLCVEHGRNCHKPCVTWARGQPDFRFSYDACIARCLKEFPCDRGG